MVAADSPPGVRFLEDANGHRVAYAVRGEGPPLRCTAWWVSHLEDDWSNPHYRAFFSYPLAGSSRQP